MKYKNLLLMFFGVSATDVRNTPGKEACLEMPNHTILCPPPHGYLPIENEFVIKNFNNKLLDGDSVPDELRAQLLQSIMRLRLISEEQKYKIDALLTADNFFIETFNASTEALISRGMDDARARFLCSPDRDDISILQIPITPHMKHDVLDTILLHEISHASDQRIQIQYTTEKEITCYSNISIKQIKKDLIRAKKMLNPETTKSREDSERLSRAIAEVNDSLTPYSRFTFGVISASIEVQKEAKALLATGKFYTRREPGIDAFIWVTAVNENGILDACLTDPSIPLTDKNRMTEAEIRKDLQGGLNYIHKVIQFYPKEHHSAEYVAYTQELLGRYPALEAVLIPEVVKARQRELTGSKKLKPK